MNHSLQLYLFVPRDIRACKSHWLIPKKVFDKPNMHEIKKSFVQFWLSWDLFAIMYETCTCTTTRMVMKRPGDCGVKTNALNISEYKTYNRDLNLVDCKNLNAS